MDLLEFLVVQLSKSSKVLTLEALATAYLIEECKVSEDSIDFSKKVLQTESSIKRIIKQQNERYIKDNMMTPFLLKGTSENLLTKTHTLEILEKSFTALEENPHIFSDRVGYEILKRLGCTEENIRLTPKSRDKGIDYWGELELSNMPSSLPHRVLIIGQVKMNTGTTPVTDLREFVGAVKTALAVSEFGKNYNEHSPNILHFVTTGELTREGENIARIFNVQVFKKRHLIEMNLLH